MKWWIFFPALYFSIAANLICADWLHWDGASADVLIWLWSVVAMRTEIRRSVPQAAIVGLLRDLAVGTPFGLSAVALVCLTWGFGTLFRSGKTGRRLWLLWALPLMFLGMGTIHAFDCYHAGVMLSPRNHMMATFWPAIVTYFFGGVTGTVMFASGRLIPLRSFQEQEQIETSSFFLSR